MMLIFQTLKHLLIILVTLSYPEDCVCTNSSVCLKYEIKHGILSLICKVSELSFLVTISNEDGSVSKTCQAPSHQQNLKMCDTNVTQNLETNITVLVVDAKNININNKWYCKHGSNRGSDSVTIHQDNGSLKNKNKDCVEENSYDFTSHIVYISLIVILITYIILDRKFDLWELCKRRCVVRKVTGNTCTSENTPLITKQSKCYSSAIECSICTHTTAIIFCETCKYFFCQHCNQHHLYISDKAHIFKQIKLIESQGSSKCMMCNSNDTVKVCTECKKSLCTNCGCDKENHVQFVRYFVSENSGNGCPDCRVVVQNNQVNNKSDVKIPKGKIPTRISGLSVVDESSFAIADSNNKTLKVFQVNSWYTIGLSSEPRNMTSLGDGKVALSFPYEKLITIYNLKKPGRKTGNTIHLHDIGRPYNLAYNDGHFAVEIAECDDGHIVIIDKDGNVVAKIETARYHAYFTGHTMRLGLNYSKKLVYISAMSKKAVTCLDFAGNKMWNFEIPSPRGLAVIYSNLNKVKILMVSKRGNAIYFLNPDTNEDQILMSGKNIMKPRYIAYNSHTHDLYVTVLGNDDEEQVTIFNLQYQMD